jgi:hypothetical protein
MTALEVFPSCASTQTMGLTTWKRFMRQGCYIHTDACARFDRQAGRHGEPLRRARATGVVCVLVLLQWRSYSNTVRAACAGNAWATV